MTLYLIITTAVFLAVLIACHRKGESWLAATLWAFVYALVWPMPFVWLYALLRIL